MNTVNKEAFIQQENSQCYYQIKRSVLKKIIHYSSEMTMQ
jgi:hypothetical protein